MENKPAESISEEEMWYFVGDSQEYYIRKWTSQGSPEKCISWNWASFLAGIYWFGYRKMYKAVMCILCLFLVIDILQDLLKISITFWITPIIWIIFGLSGNALYYRHMRRKISCIRADKPFYEAYIGRIAEAGGISGAGIAITLLLNIIYFLILLLINKFLYSRF